MNLWGSDLDPRASFQEIREKERKRVLGNGFLKRSRPLESEPLGRLFWTVGWFDRDV